MTLTHETPLPPLAVGTRGAGKLLDISERNIAELVAKNAIPSFKIGGRRLFSVEALKAWIAAKVAAAAEIEAAESEVPHVE